MKKILILITIILTMSCGTDLGEGNLYKYSLVNNSGKTIIIKSYLDNSPNLDAYIIKLEVGENLTKTYQDALPPSTYDFSNFFGEINNPSDSIIVFYDNLKYQRFKIECSDNLRNPLNFCKIGGIEVTFEFTEQDYEKAEYCNSNCD